MWSSRDKRPAQHVLKLFPTPATYKTISEKSKALNLVKKPHTKLVVYVRSSPIFSLYSGILESVGLPKEKEAAYSALTTFTINPNPSEGDHLFSPPKSCLVSLAQAYFKYVNVHQPIVNQDELFKILSSNSYTFPHQALIMMVCLSGMSYTNQTTNTEELKQYFTSRLLFLFKRIYMMPCLASVQAFLLASHWHISDTESPIMNKSHSYYLTACNMAKMIGLHSINRAMKLSEQRTRMLVWLSIYNTGAFLFASGSIAFPTAGVTKIKTSELAPLFKEIVVTRDQHIIQYFKSTTLFSGILQAYAQIKLKYKGVSKEFSETGSFSEETAELMNALNSVEEQVISWYRSLPLSLRSKSRNNSISIPSSRNPFSCRIHILFFYLLLDINSLKISSSQWTSFSFRRLSGANAKISDSIPVHEYLRLSPLEKCAIVSHLVVGVFGPSLNRCAVLNGNAFNWVCTFRITLFLVRFFQSFTGQYSKACSKTREEYPLVFNALEKDKRSALNVIERGSSKLSILKDSLDVLNLLENF